MEKGLILDVKEVILCVLSAASNLLLVIYPALSGITTYKTTEISNVSHGTTILVTPSNRAAIGANANIMIMSFIET